MYLYVSITRCRHMKRPHRSDVHSCHAPVCSATLMVLAHMVGYDFGYFALHHQNAHISLTCVNSFLVSFALKANSAWFISGSPISFQKKNTTQIATDELLSRLKLHTRLAMTLTYTPPLLSLLPLQLPASNHTASIGWPQTCTCLRNCPCRDAAKSQPILHKLRTGRSQVQKDHSLRPLLSTTGTSAP
jgi:hypothetical protein